MHATTAHPSDRRRAAALQAAAKRRLQSPDDQGLAAWLAAHTDAYDYERLEPGLDGRPGTHLRPPNAVVEAALNGPRHAHLRKLQVDDVRRHRAAEHTLRATPVHAQRRASAALRIDADAHAGQLDAAALIAFLDDRFFRPRGRPLHAEPSDRGHAGYFTFDMARLHWRGGGGDAADEGPRGDGTYVRRATWYNALFRRVQLALQRIAAHHGFAATVELNGRFTVTARDEARRIAIAASGTVYDAQTWDVIDSPNCVRPDASAADVDAATPPWPFERTTPGEIPGRLRLVTRGETFRAPRCPRPGDVERLKRAHFPEAVLDEIVRYAEALDATAAAKSRPAATTDPADAPNQPTAEPTSTIAPQRGPTASRTAKVPKRVRRAGRLASAAADEVATASNPFAARFRAVRHAALETGFLGGDADFDGLPDHVQDALVARAMGGGVPGTDEQYRRDFRKLFRTYDPGPPLPKGGQGGLWADERVDFPRAEQMLRSRLSRDRIAGAKRPSTQGQRSPIRGRLDYDTLAIALICLALNANKVGSRRDGGRSKLDHCPTLAVINWMAYFGHSVNGSWVAAAMKLVNRAGLIACVTRKYVPGKFARRYAVVGAARRLPFVAHLYVQAKPEPGVKDTLRAARKRYATNTSFPLPMARQGREMESFPEGMKGHGVANHTMGGASWPIDYVDWLAARPMETSGRNSGRSPIP